MLNLRREEEKEEEESEDEIMREPRKAVKEMPLMIYCNGSSSRGALHLKGIIITLRGINKVSFIFQGAPRPFITILPPS